MNLSDADRLADILRGVASDARAVQNPEPRPAVAHRVRWWVYAGGERIPRTSTMRGRWDYDATCSCGWDSRSGGGVRSSIERAVADHRFDVEFYADHPEYTAPWEETD
jgi:hypothetical protein